MSGRACRDEQLRVVNKLGDPVAVVHQWDRSPVLTEQYDLQYPYTPVVVSAPQAAA